MENLVSLIQCGDVQNIARTTKNNKLLKKRMFLNEACRFGQLESVKFLLREFEAKLNVTTVGIAITYHRWDILTYFISVSPVHRNRIFLACPKLKGKFAQEIHTTLAKLIGDSSYLVLEYLGFPYGR